MQGCQRKQTASQTGAWTEEKKQTNNSNTHKKNKASTDEQAKTCSDKSDRRANSYRNRQMDDCI